MRLPSSAKRQLPTSGEQEVIPANKEKPIPLSSTRPYLGACKLASAVGRTFSVKDEKIFLFTQGERQRWRYLRYVMQVNPTMSRRKSCERKYFSLQVRKSITRKAEKHSNRSCKARKGKVFLRAWFSALSLFDSHWKLFRVESFSQSLRKSTVIIIWEIIETTPELVWLDCWAVGMNKINCGGSNWTCSPIIPQSQSCSTRLITKIELVIAD